MNSSEIGSNFSNSPICKKYGLYMANGTSLSPFCKPLSIEELVSIGRCAPISSNYSVVDGVGRQ
ncbi:MAG: hypothetical protein WA461_15290 [Nitrososphaeraceae archaeon]